MVAPEATAICRAAVICAAVSGLGVWISQPSGTSCSPRAWTARAVITVFGAEVPAGRLSTAWIFGLARQLLAGQGSVWDGPAPGSGGPSGGANCRGGMWHTDCRAEGGRRTE